MAVTFDAVGSVGVGAVQSASFTMTIGAAANRAAIVTFGHREAGQTNYTVSVGTDSMPAIAGTAVNGVILRSAMFGGILTVTGSQTVSGSWTAGGGDAVATMACISVSGANQTTPINGGVNAHAESGTSWSLSVTSTNGDLTLDGGYGVAFLGDIATNQTQRYHFANGDQQTGGATGPGTGTTTHTWTNPQNDRWAMSGANFVQAAAGVTYPQLERGIRGLERGLVVGMKDF
jgi:hypothetical protein